MLLFAVFSYVLSLFYTFYTCLYAVIITREDFVMPIFRPPFFPPPLTHRGRGGGIMYCQFVDCTNKFQGTATGKFRLAINLVRASNSRSGGHEFKSPVWQELYALRPNPKSLAGWIMSTLAKGCPWYMY
jgi:hypothetical protein